MSDHRDPRTSETEPSPELSRPTPLGLIDECLVSMPDEDPRRRILFRIRHLLLQEATQQQQREAEFRKMHGIVEKLTAPANRVGTLLEVPAEGLARIAVGGAEYYTNVDPRVAAEELKIGTQVLVNEAYAVIKTLGYDRNGPVVKIGETLEDGRLRIEQEPGRGGLILQRSSDLLGADLKPGDQVRVDPTQRIAVERLETRQGRRHLLDEIPKVTWEQIGGQQAAIEAIRRAIEYPLLHAETFKQFEFTQPKGFLLYGPPGCGKTLIGQATAASLAQVAAQEDRSIKGGLFLHVKGPEILNMWLGESERMVRDLFEQARQRREEGFLPFIFIDEAESILGTRRAMRSFNISNTLVPMFCTEMDGIESLREVVVILASNRPDLIDPAVLRPGRIDRKIKVGRPGRTEAAEILKVYLTPTLPLAPALLERHAGEAAAARETLIAQVLDLIFRRTDENRVLAVRFRNGQHKTLYRADLLSGAILAAIVQRAKERAIERTITGSTISGLTPEDLVEAAATEFREGELLPPDEAAEEWLKLLDHHPEQVVGISSYRAGRVSDERVLGII